MSASVTMHGPFEAGARLIEAGKFSEKPFISLDISTNGASVTLIAVDAGSLEALSAALGSARVLWGSIQPDDPPEQAPAIVPTGTGWPVK